jgi:hypothetical protein
MSGAILPLPLYAFMTCIGRTVKEDWKGNVVTYFKVHSASRRLQVPLKTNSEQNVKNIIVQDHGWNFTGEINHLNQ